jgi:hypothetical protein
MTSCDQIRHEIGGYVLGALEPAEAAAVRAHIERCPECAEEHAALAKLPALLDLAQGIDTAATPAPSLEERVLDGVARSPRTGSRRRAWPHFLRLPTRARRPLALVAVGLACAALGGAVAAVVVGGGDGDQLESPSGYQVALTGTAASPGANARAALESVPGGTTVLMWVSGLPGDPDTVYEVLCEHGNTWSASAGTFRVDRDGQASLTLNTAAKRGQYDRIRVVRHGWDAATHQATQTNVMTSERF